jgi:signal transduction histidine kinase
MGIRDSARTAVRRVRGAFGRRFWAELVWVLTGVPLGVVFLLLILLGFVFGIGLAAVFAGVLILAGTLLAARRLGGTDRRLASALLGVRVAAPLPRRMEPGFWGWLKARLGDFAAWRAVAYRVLRVPVAVLDLLTTGFVVMYGLALLTYPVFWFLLPGDRTSPLFGIHTGVWLGTIPFALFGLALLAALPWLVHGLLGLDRLLVRGLLGPTTLSERVRDLESSRATAVEDATVRLRRIERDLHDGAQARLVALAMKLGLVKDELEAEDLDRAQLATLVGAAHTNAKQALTELRDLARGIHPPALDAGLSVALSTLASEATADVRLRVELDRRPSPTIETIVYFTAAELLANATKYGGGEVAVTVRGDPGRLVLTVADGGRGGARIVEGGGLAGLADRVRTVDGRLEVTSPAGGPTVVIAEIPLSGTDTACAS